MTYEQYRTLMDDVLAQHRTTGPDQSEGLVKYTELNRHRMRKWDKILVLNPEFVQLLTAVDKPMIWLVLTEAWCGDAAQNLPAIAKMAEVNPLIQLRLLLRDEHPAVMDAYLTGGSRSIPKLIALEGETLRELGTWGPRPAEAQQLVVDYKHNPNGRTREQFYEQMHAWYAKDQARQVQLEFAQLLQTWKTV